MQLKTLLPYLLTAIVIIGTFGSQNAQAQFAMRHTTSLWMGQITNAPALRTGTPVEPATSFSTTQQTSNQTSIQNRFFEEVFYFGICICGLVIILVGVVIYYWYDSKRRKETDQTELYSNTPQPQATQTPQQSAPYDDMVFCIQCGFRMPRTSKTCKECGATQV